MKRKLSVLETLALVQGEGGEDPIVKKQKKEKKPAVVNECDSRQVEKDLANAHGANAETLDDVIGIDETRRGCWIGSVVAACCIIPTHVDIPGINDSKKIKTEEQREELFKKITSHPDVTYAYKCIEADEIDRINILQATFVAMNGAMGLLSEKDLQKIKVVCVDGNKVPPKLQSLVPGAHCEAIVKGDARCRSIAAASIIAKVIGDRLAHEYHKQYPEYAFNQNKGYGTSHHKEMLDKYGPCSLHRKSFEPMRSIILSTKS